MVGSLVTGLGFRVAPERLNLRAPLPLRRALPVAGAAAAVAQLMNSAIAVNWHVAAAQT